MMATERACVLVGGFLGGILVFLQFWPHFQIVPKPPTEIIITCARLVLLTKIHLMLKKDDYKWCTGWRAAHMRATTDVCNGQCR